MNGHHHRAEGRRRAPRAAAPGCRARSATRRTGCSSRPCWRRSTASSAARPRSRRGATGRRGRRPSSPSPASVQPQSVLRAQVTAATRRPEAECLPLLLQRGGAAARRRRPQAQPRWPAASSRRCAASGARGPVEGLIQEYCAVQPGRRGADVPGRGAAAHPRPRHPRRADPRQDRPAATGTPISARSQSLFVNAATWGLLVTGRLTATSSEAGLTAALTRLIGRGGEPLIRARRRCRHAHDGRAVRHRPDHRRGAGQRPPRWRPSGFRYSYDMLGEAAMTAADAARYRGDYEQAIQAVGRAVGRARASYAGRAFR